MLSAATTAETTRVTRSLVAFPDCTVRSVTPGPERSCRAPVVPRWTRSGVCAQHGPAVRSGARAQHDPAAHAALLKLVQCLLHRLGRERHLGDGNAGKDPSFGEADQVVQVAGSPDETSANG